MKKRYGLILAVVLVFAGELYAATTGVDFLRLSVGARATGMGESAAGVYSDVTATCWNPAGIAQLSRPELGLMHSEAVMDANQEFLGFAYPSLYGVFALSGIFHIYQPMPVTLDDGTTFGELNWMDTALAFTYARFLNSVVSFGASGKVIQRRESNPIFGTSEGTSCAFDAGVIYRTPVKGLQAGLALLNTGSDLRMSGEVKNDVLPQTTRLGIAYERPLSGGNILTLSSDLHKILDGSWYGGCGLELGMGNSVFLRSGYYQKEGNIEGITYGVGVKIKNFQVDYSNVPSSELVGYTRNSKVSLLVQF